MGIEEEGNAKVNNLLATRKLIAPKLQIALLQEDTDIESKLTSVSS